MNIYLAINDDDIAACMALRYEVFINEQNVPEELEVDGEDAEFQHVLVNDDGVPFGAARFRNIDDYAKVQRVCVPAKARGKGVGAQIMQFIIGEVRRQGEVQYVTLSSQLHAVPFYEKLGFKVHGAEYMDAGIPHFDMNLEL